MSRQRKFDYTCSVCKNTRIYMFFCFQKNNLPIERWTLDFCNDYCCFSLINFISICISLVFPFCSPGVGLLHQKQHRYKKSHPGNQIHCQSTHREILLQCVRRSSPFHHRCDFRKTHLQHREYILFPFCFSVDVHLL